MDKNCPHCKIDLRGEPIPEEHFVHKENCQEQVANYGRCYCLPYGEREPEDRFFSQIIGLEIPGVYDGTLLWVCPSCLKRWHRFPEGHYLRARAEPYLEVA